MFLIETLIAMSGLVALPHQAQAQLSIEGIAWDSLRNAPLRNAFITIKGRDENTTSDANGRFHFDSLAPGEYILGLQHGAVDSVGFSGLSKKVTVKQATDTVVIGIPTFATIWRHACGVSSVPSDSVLLFGTIRSANGAETVPNAIMRIRWTNVGFSKNDGVTRSAWGGEVRSDANGEYRVCGVPSDEVIQVQAVSRVAMTPVLEVTPGALHVRRLDVMLPAVSDSGRTVKGTIAGVVHDQRGAPIVGARVTAEGLPEVRTTDGGRFLLSGVSTGTRQLEVLSVGRAPQTVLVDVVPHDTTTVELEMHSVASLKPVTITESYARQRRFDEIVERRKLGLGHFLDSTDVAVHSSIADAIGMVVEFQRICALYLDGVLYRFRDIEQELKFRSPKDIALIESLRGIAVPFQYRTRQCNNSTVLLVWTKAILP
jgi:hypothetical protein